jgi:hypothetical protein
LISHTLHFQTYFNATTILRFSTKAFLRFKLYYLIWLIIMPLTKTQKNLLVAGGLIVIGGVTAYAVAKALAKPKKEEVTPPPEEVPPPTYPPASIDFVEYPTALTQLYGFYYEMPTPVSPQCLRFQPLVSFEGPPYPVGYIWRTVRVKVVDALGRGVPNQPLLFWSVPTEDDQTGFFQIDEKVAGFDNPVRKITNGNGEASVLVNYQLRNDKIKILEDKLDFGCYTLLGRLWDIDVGGCCYPLAYNFIGRRADEGKTDPRAYVVYVKLEGTTLQTPLGMTCYAWGRALW